MPETGTIQETMAGQVRILGEMPSMLLPPLGRVFSCLKSLIFPAQDHSFHKNLAGFS